MILGIRYAIPQQGTWVMPVYQDLFGAVKRNAFQCFAIWLLGSLGIAPPLPAQLRLPQPIGYVNDFANVIPAEDEARIERISDEVRAKSGGEIVVVTLPSLDGRPLEEVGLQIGREWRIGRSGEPGDPARNTGVVLLIAPQERRLRIETGLGTQTFLAAGEAGRIRDELIVPAFAEGDFGRGALLGVAAIAQAYAERFGFALTGDVPELPAADAPREGVPGGGMLLFLLLILIFFVLASRGGRGGGGGGGHRRRRGYGGPVIIPFPMGGRGGGWGGGGGRGFRGRRIRGVRRWGRVRRGRCKWRLVRIEHWETEWVKS